MKRFLVILAIALSSCSVDEARTTNEPQGNCSCETILKADTFRLPNGYTWTVVTLANDCTGAQRQTDLVGRHILGDKICN
jgi:hypothetical protein